MSRAKMLLVFGAVVMVAAIAYALVVGAFFSELKMLGESPWFQLSLIDLYVGFFLFAGWILFREERRGTAVAWIVALLLLGNLVACVYAMIAAVRARGDWRVFWLGGRAGAP